MEETLIKALQNPALYTHEITHFEVCETHISWVLLTGEFAYKIKKPVNFGFVDFTTLEKRQHFCELELALNQNLAPSLYIRVVPITGTPDNPTIDGEGPIIEYAIKMNQFEQNRLLSSVAEEEGLSRAIIRSLSMQIADFHQKIEPVDENSLFGSPAHVYEPVRDNFATLKMISYSKIYRNDLQTLETWSQETFEKLNPIIQERKEQGHVRACHGDIHLGNIVLLDGHPTIFDCIEFNDEFRHIDTINDMAFLAMDLEHKGYLDLSHYFANTYFELTGDYHGLPLLNFYKTYRAMVRAKISAIQLEQVSKQSALFKTLKSDLEKYIHLGLSYPITAKPTLTITYGPSGCGKSHYTDQLLIQTKAFRLRSDVLRKQLFNLPIDAPTPDNLKAEVYSSETTEMVYHKLFDMSHLLLSHGISVIIDATCLKRWQRELFLRLSHDYEVPFKVLAFEWDKSLLEERIKARQDKTSDASLEVLKLQLESLEPLNEVEGTYAEMISKP